MQFFNRRRILGLLESHSKTKVSFFIVPPDKFMLMALNEYIYTVYIVKYFSMVLHVKDLQIEQLNLMPFLRRGLCQNGKILKIKKVVNGLFVKV
jgi:hypothetical protein